MSLMLARQRAAKAGNGEGETVVSPSVIASGKAGLLAANQTAALVSASLAEDLEALHSIASFERKAVFKRDTLLPKYAEYVGSVTPNRRTTCWAMPLSGCSTAGSSSAPLILLAGAWSTGSGFPTVSSRRCPCSSRSGRSNGPRRNTMPGAVRNLFSGRCSIVCLIPIRYPPPAGDARLQRPGNAQTGKAARQERIPGRGQKGVPSRDRPVD